MDRQNGPSLMRKNSSPKINTKAFDDWQRAFEKCERRMAELKIEMEQNYTTKMKQIDVIESNLFGR